jgi:hypothetical protein
MPIPIMRFKYWNYIILRCYSEFVEVMQISFVASKNRKEKKHVSRSEVPVPSWRQPRQNES